MMKKDRVTIVLFSLLAVMAFAPMVQEHLDFPKVRSLAGVTPETKLPKINLTNYRNGKCQRAAEQYLKYHFGYRPNVIRLYNQYLWDFYKKTHNKTNLCFGKEGWIYEPWFVEDHFHGGTYSQRTDSLNLAKKFDQEAFRLLQIQNILESYGTTLIVCQAPGKDLIYPEFLPDDTVTTRPKQLSARDAYEARFNQLGINHVNIEQLFLQMKDTASFLLFPQKGTHWSNIASIYAADSLFHYIEAKKGVQMNQLEIGAPYIAPYRKPDYDLEELLNLCRPLEKLPQHSVDVRVRQVPGAVKPKMIVIGDSYYWNICAQISIKSMFTQCPYWYYNSTIHFDSLHNSTSEVNLAQELLDADVVMLMYCSTQLYKMSNGFSQQALLALCCDEDDLQKATAACIQQIKNSPRWFESVKQRAEEYHKPLEEFLEGEAKNQVMSKPNQYIPALKDRFPAKRSSQVTEYITLKNNRDGIQ